MEEKNELLLLREVDIDHLVPVLDGLKEFENPVIEALDGSIYSMALKVINKQASPIVPDDLKDNVHEILDLVWEGNYTSLPDEIEELAIDILVYADVSPVTANILEALIALTKAGIIAYIDSKKED